MCFPARKNIPALRVTVPAECANLPAFGATVPALYGNISALRRNTSAERGNTSAERGNVRAIRGNVSANRVNVPGRSRDCFRASGKPLVAVKNEFRLMADCPNPGAEVIFEAENSNAGKRFSLNLSPNLRANGSWDQ